MIPASGRTGCRRGRRGRPGERPGGVDRDRRATIIGVAWPDEDVEPITKASSASRCSGLVPAWRARSLMWLVARSSTARSTATSTASAILAPSHRRRSTALLFSPFVRPGRPGDLSPERPTRRRSLLGRAHRAARQPCAAGSMVTAAAAGTSGPRRLGALPSRARSRVGASGLVFGDLTDLGTRRPVRPQGLVPARRAADARALRRDVPWTPHRRGVSRSGQRVPTRSVRIRRRAGALATDAAADVLGRKSGR